MGPVAVDDTATIIRGEVVQLSSGEVVAGTSNMVANLAVALDKFPDAEYEGTKAVVNLALLGEDVEVEIPFATTDTAGITQSQVGGGGPFGLNATSGAVVVDLTDTTNDAFTPRRLGRDTSLGDMTGYVIGVFLDSVSL
jgi:hypothetical protein